jgi:ATP-dependent helicase/nuclease subunit A
MPVRVMTVHGSKGLQAPVVILADACVDPARARGSSVDFALADGTVVPLFRPRKDELAEPLKSQIEQSDRLDREEHWRLLYVAMTRAEERLYIGGALGPADRNGPPQGSWYAACRASMDALGLDWMEDPHWGRSCRLGEPEAPARPITAKRAVRASAPPDWLRAPAPVESRPPRPLAPSGRRRGRSAYPPPGPELRAAAERGRLLHLLFERLPGVAQSDRARLAEDWLERAAGVADADLRRTLVPTRARSSAIRPMPTCSARMRSPRRRSRQSRPGGAVIAGTADRLLVTPDLVRVVDFKTGRAVPRSAPRSRRRISARWRITPPRWK